MGLEWRLVIDSLVEMYHEKTRMYPFEKDYTGLGKNLKYIYNFENYQKKRNETL